MKNKIDGKDVLSLDGVFEKFLKNKKYSIHPLQKAYLEGIISEDVIEKAWNKHPIGTVVTRKDGTKWKKVSETGNSKQDWKPLHTAPNSKPDDQNKKKRLPSGEENDGKQPKLTKHELSKHAQETSETALRAAIKESPDSEVRETAHEELDRREKEEKVQEEDKKGSEGKAGKEEEIPDKIIDNKDIENIIKYLRDSRRIKPSTEKFYRENINKYNFTVDEGQFGYSIKIIDKKTGSGSSYPVDNNILEDSNERKVKTVGDLVDLKKIGHYNDPDDEYAQDLDEYLKESKIDWRKESSLESLEPSQIKASEWNDLTDKENNKKVEKYSKMDPANMPPIIAVRNNDGSIEAIDGIHRVWAAEKLGVNVPAIVMTEKMKNSLNTSDSKMEQFLLNKYKNSKMDFDQKIKDKKGIEKSVEITNNLGEKKMVSKGFADAFNKAKERGKELFKGKELFEEIPEWDFPQEDNKSEQKQKIQKSYEKWL